MNENDNKEILPVEPITVSETDTEPETLIESHEVVDQEAEIQRVLESIQPQRPIVEEQPVVEPVQPIVEEESVIESDVTDSLNPEVDRVLASIQPQQQIQPQPMPQQPINNNSNYNNRNNDSGNGTGGAIVSIILILILTVAIVIIVGFNPLGGEKVENTSTPTPSLTPTSTPVVTPTSTPKSTPVNTSKPTSTPVVTPTATPVPTATPEPTPTPTPEIITTNTIVCSGKGKYYDIKSTILYDVPNKKAVEVSYNYKLSANKNTEGLTEDEKSIIVGLSSSAAEFEKYKNESGVTYNYQETESGLNMYFNAKKNSSTSDSLNQYVFEKIDGKTVGEIVSFVSDPELGINCTVN